MSGLGLSLGFGRWIHRSSGADPTATAQPALSGNAIVGQRIFASAGTYSSPPTSVDYSWELDDGTAYADTADNHLCDNIEQGHTIRRKEVAHFSGHPDVTNYSAASSTIADRVVDSVSLTRTSALAASPLTYSIAWGGLTNGLFPGDVLEAQVCADTTFNSFSQRVPHTLTADEIATPSLLPAAFTADGLTDPGSTEAMRVVLTARLPDDTVVPIGGRISSTIGKNYTPVSVRDNFDDGIVDTTLWGADANWNPGRATQGTVSEINGRLEVTPSGTAGTIARVTLNSASFRGKFVQIERSIVSYSGACLTGLRVGPTPSTGYYLEIAGGNVSLQACDGSGGVSLGLSFSDTDYGGDVAPTTYAHFRLWNDYSAGVRDDIVVLTAPSSASRPPASGDWTEKLRVARSSTYWNGTDACYHAIIGGQWTDNADAPNHGTKFDNYHTDAAV